MRGFITNCFKNGVLTFYVFILCLFITKSNKISQCHLILIKNHIKRNVSNKRSAYNKSSSYNKRKQDADARNIFCIFLQGDPYKIFMSN